MSEDFLSCSVCLENFNDHKRAPLILVCGHTFCADCIKSLLSAKSKIKCPNCNKEDSRDPKDLSKNYLITDIVLKLSYSQPTKEDPWLCKIHPAETIIYICQKTKKLLCCECLHSNDFTDLVEITQKDIREKILMFKGLYEIATPSDLKERGRFAGLLSESLECQKLRILQNYDDMLMESLQNIENYFSSAKAKVRASIEKEQEKLLYLKDVLCLLGEMKTVGTKIEDMVSRALPGKAHQVIWCLAGLNDIGSSSEIKKLGNTPIELSFKLEVPQKLLNVTSAIVECPVNLIKGVSENSDVGEKKLSRFNPPTNRWGIFEGRNQIEAVSFSVNQKVYLSGIGVGNAYHPGKTVKLEKLSILDGGSTQSPLLYEETGMELTFEANANKVVKIPFKRAIEIKENSDFTIKLVLRGGAGVFRGGSTTRSRNGENGLVFKFKNAIYGGDDVKNGENADDGPIFDLYYKTMIESHSNVDFVRYSSITGTHKIQENKNPYIFSFIFNKPISLTSFTVPGPDTEDSILTIKKVDIIKGKAESGEKIYSHKNKIEIQFNPNGKVAQILLDQAMLIEANYFYSIVLEISACSVHGVNNMISSKVTCNNIVMTSVNYNGFAYQDCSELPIILMLQGSSNENLSNFTKISVPDNFLEDSVGENCVRRFESYEKQWNLVSDEQFECFSFNFSENVIITALGLGNCAKTDSFITVDSLQILNGPTSACPALYDHSNQFNLFNSCDNNPVIKVRLESPVKIEKNKIYTLKVALRGEGKAYKGKNFLGQSITLMNDIKFESIKTKFKSGNKQNGDNEQGGPIFDVYFLTQSHIPAIENFNKVISVLYPRSKQELKEIVLSITEYKVCRYNSSGSSWHVNTDGKQIEAISFRPSCAVKLIAIGIGNAHSEGKKVTVTKIQIKEGKSTNGDKKIYKHKKKVKLINTDEESKFVKVDLESAVTLLPENWYILMVKYKPGVPVCRGTMANNSPTCNGITFTFEKAKYEGSDVENGSHEVHGPLRDFYFTLI